MSLTIKSSMRNILRNGSVVLSGSMAANLFGLLSLAIFTNNQGAEKIGYYVLIITYVEIINKIFNFQTWQAFIKYGTEFQFKNEDHNLMMLVKYSFLIDLASLAVAFTIALLSVNLFISKFEIPVQYTHLVSIVSITLLFKVFEISIGIFRIFDEFKVQAKITVISSFAKLIMFSVVALLAPSLSAFVYATVLAQAVALLMKIKLCKQVLNRNGFSLKGIVIERIDFKVMKKLKIISFIVYNNLDVANRVISRRLDVLVLGKLCGAEVVGIYRIAKEVANIVAKFSDPVYQAVYPEFALLLAKGEKNETLEVAKKISFYAGLVGVGGYGLFVIFGNWAIGFAFGKEFLESYSIGLVYMISTILAVISLPLPSLMQAMGLVKHAFYNQLISALIYCIVLIIFSIHYAAIGAAFAMILFNMSWLIIALVIVRKHLLG